MKKYILISGIVILGFAVSSCTEDKNTTEETTAPEEGTETVVTSDENASGDQQPINFDEQSVNIDQSTAAPVSNAGGNTAGVRLNPAHGEPGHVCEVAVGAPLPADGAAPAPAASAPAQNMQIQNNSQPSITSSPVQAPTSIMNTSAPSSAPAPASAGTTAPGMNPPHGEPGHDCAIPVGAPLKK